MKVTKLKFEKIPNAALVIFGATGDLTKRKLIPALYKLYSRGKIKNNLPIVCVARKNFTKSQFIKSLEIKKFIKRLNEREFNQFCKHLYYFPLDFGNQNYSKLNSYLQKLEKTYKSQGNRLFYLATPHSLFPKVVDKLKQGSMLKGKGWKRVVFEKPFGHDLQSARKLNKHITSTFKENQIYRIDHYLGKELVQNILIFRFANTLFEHLWSNRFIDNVQVIIDEKLGVEKRGRYYDKAGAIRDMVQNHLLQILSLFAMEAPRSMHSDDVRAEKAKILSTLRKVKPSDLVIGQYSGYRSEKGVDKKSNTETFAALKTYIDNMRWKGVPFYLRTGKKLKNNYAEVNLILKKVPDVLFPVQKEKPNVSRMKALQ